MKNVGGFQTPFATPVMPSQVAKGDNVSVSNGVVLNGGEKGTGTVCGPLVTTVTVNGVGSISGSVGIGGTIANKG